MGDKYFRLRNIKTPSANGVVIKYSDDSLEVIAGESRLKELDVSLDEGGNLKYKKENYTLTEIDETWAKQLRESYFNWKFLQAWVRQDAHPRVIMVNTPGLPEHARLRS